MKITDAYKQDKRKGYFYFIKKSDNRFHIIGSETGYHYFAEPSQWRAAFRVYRLNLNHTAQGLARQYKQAKATDAPWLIDVAYRFCKVTDAPQETPMTAWVEQFIEANSL